ncbi:MAG: cobalamin B12-binding domain-containing protein [Candidatus Methanomethylicaceae archaeon]|jgi:methanogenic corrinoid protein MtbC1
MTSADPLKNMATAILSGNGSKGLDSANKALADGFSIDDIITNGVLSAWKDFCDWYTRDPMGSLKAWMDCVNATQKILKLLDSTVNVQPKPPFSVIVATVKAEGHTLMRDILALMLKSRGLKVYTSRRGVLVEDLGEPLSDSSLKFVVLSCIEDQSKPNLEKLVKGIRAKRPDMRIIAGGPLAELSGADMVIADPVRVYDTLMHLAKSG